MQYQNERERKLKLVFGFEFWKEYVMKEEIKRKKNAFIESC